MPSTQFDFDVIIAGTGIYGTVLGAILARHGARVLLVERGRHPRFALGEAMLPQSAIWPFVLAQRFGVPEIGHLSHADHIVDHITQSCGLKHSIGFAWHREGSEVEPGNVHQLVPPHLPFYSESHLYREDVDLFLLKTAQEYGCEYVDLTEITHVDCLEDSVTVVAGDRRWTGQVFVDGSGGGSSFVRQMGYRDSEMEARTHSRCIFAHVEDLPPIDQWLQADSEGRRLHDGTFHHMFPGGWMWVIPFDNFHRSTSAITSVGLMLDTRVYPADESLSPEEEFFSFVRRFPTMATHLAKIRPIRPFTRTGRLQSACTTSVGLRHVLGPSTFGLIDAIYSNGLVHTFESVFRTAPILLSSLGLHDGPTRVGDFSADALRPIDSLHRAQWADADRMASCAYAAMKHPATWAAWTQAWLAQVLFSDLWLQRACFLFFEAGNPTALDVLMAGERPGSASPLASTRERLLDDLAALLDESADPAKVAERMFARLREEDWLPRHVYDWGSPSARSIDFSRPEVAGALLEWGFTASPEALRSGLFDFSLPGPPPGAE